MTRTSAGARLRATMDAALVATGIAGAEFDEHELEALGVACAAADRAEQLTRLYNRELTSGAPAPSTLARLSAEIRACERQKVNMLERVRLTTDAPKSARHSRAARARWDRRDRANAPTFGAAQ